MAKTEWNTSNKRKLVNCMIKVATKKKIDFYEVTAKDLPAKVHENFDEGTTAAAVKNQVNTVLKLDPLLQGVVPPSCLCTAAMTHIVEYRTILRKLNLKAWEGVFVDNVKDVATIEIEGTTDVTPETDIEPFTWNQDTMEIICAELAIAAPTTEGGVGNVRLSTEALAHVTGAPESEMDVILESVQYMASGNYPDSMKAMDHQIVRFRNIAHLYGFQVSDNRAYIPTFTPMELLESSDWVVRSGNRIIITDADALEKFLNEL